MTSGATAQHLLTELANGNLRAASKWALDVGIAARITEGVAGTLVIQIPRNLKDQVEVAFVAGTTTLGLDFPLQR